MSIAISRPITERNNQETRLFDFEKSFVNSDNITNVTVGSDSQIILVCRLGKRLLEQLGFRPCDSTLVVTVISELARNIVLYAGVGEIILRNITSSDNRVGIVITARDQGPGIEALSLAQQDGFSTSGGLGLGLPGVTRIMDAVEIHSQEGEGTIVNTMKWKT